VSENYIPPHAHNGFIELGLDVGLIGLSIFLVSFTIAYVRALKQAYAAKNSEDFWPLAVLLFVALNNVTESYLLRLANIYWVLYITVALSVKKKRRI
jgi:exopolysaccharide production protein ExoQ